MSGLAILGLAPASAPAPSVPPIGLTIPGSTSPDAIDTADRAAGGSNQNWVTVDVFCGLLRAPLVGGKTYRKAGFLGGAGGYIQGGAACFLVLIRASDMKIVAVTPNKDNQDINANVANFFDFAAPYTPAADETAYLGIKLGGGSAPVSNPASAGIVGQNTTPYRAFKILNATQALGQPPTVNTVINPAAMQSVSAAPYLIVSP